MDPQCSNVSVLSEFDMDGIDSSATQALINGLQFINKSLLGDEGWALVETRFEELAVDEFLPKTRFGKCIGMEGKNEEEFARQLYDALARRRGIVMGMIDRAQLKNFWGQLSDQSFDARIQTFFDLVDRNGDGRISEEEVKEVISLSASTNKLSEIQKQADEYAALIMEELDRHGRGYIKLHNLKRLLLQSPSQPFMSSPGTPDITDYQTQPIPIKERPNPILRCFRRLIYYWKRVSFTLIWLTICVVLFVWKFIQYKHRYVHHVMGHCVCIAKGGAEILKFNMALILFPVCRNFITCLRNTKLGVVFPFNDNVNFHKMVAIGVAVGVGLHAGAHLTCDFTRLMDATDEEYEPLKKYFGVDKPRSYWWFVKGVEGLTGMGMMVLMGVGYLLAVLAQPWFQKKWVKRFPVFVKRLTGFEAFWYSHHLFVVVYALLIVHGEKLYLQHTWYKRTTWMYLAVPMGIYALERLNRPFRSNYKTIVQVVDVVVYPGDVVAVYMTKPEKFKYTSGQYIFLKCPDISPLQWHPFSLTSAPDDEYISLHIRTLGDWTSQLKSMFSKVCQRPRVGQSGLLRADVVLGNQIPRMPKLLIDGPYGAPAQDYKNYNVLLLVGLGIGATPLISIVKDVINNLRHNEDDLEHNIAATTTTTPAMSHFLVTKVYFYFVTREQGSFDWFRQVMNKVVEHDKGHVIELHNHCTSVYEEGDARSALIAMLQSLQQAKSGVDIVSGTRVKTHFARPKWGDVFNQVATNHQGQRVGVFYCGAPTCVAELRHLSQDFSRKTTTKFDFHKENF